MKFYGSPDPHRPDTPSEAARAAIGEGLFEEAQALAPQLSAWRQRLHQMPELGCETYQTSAYIQECLSELGVSYEPLLEGAGVLAQLGSGAGGAPCVLLRGDIDGLPFAEKSGEPWASVNGNMHACGHDMHATALLGAAALLKAHEEAILKSGGTVKLLFQPGEETLTGAKAALEAGVLANPQVNAAFGIHVNGRCPMGLMLYGKEAAGSYTFRITFIGKGGHGSVPFKCVDPIPAGIEAYTALQTLVSREIPYNKEAVLTVGKVSAGSAANVIPDECVLEATLRSRDCELLEALKVRIAQVIAGIATAFRVEGRIEVLAEVPPNVLNPDFTDQCVRYTGSAIGDVLFRNLEDDHPMGCEDFAYIAGQVPSAYFTLGAAVRDSDEHYSLHDARVRFDSAELPYAACAYASVALGALADLCQR